MAATRSKSSTSAAPSKAKFTTSSKTKTKSKHTTTTITNKKTTESTVIKKQKKTQQKQLSPSPTPTSSPSNRNKSLGVRLIRGRIYDSQNGKSCHQCRQKTVDFAVPCKSQSCVFRFCHTCLLNRYGEKAEEMAALGDWKCPKCRGICNCSKCMKKRGCCPTGMLVVAAKASGYSSVSEMLQMKNSEKAKEEDMGASPKDENASMQEGRVALPLRRKHGEENGVDVKSYSSSKSYGDDENNEKLQTEILGKNDSSEKVTKKTMEVADAGISPKRLTTFKEFGGASTKVHKTGSDSKLQPKHLTLNNNENKSQNGKLKSLSKAAANDNPMESNKEDAALTEKRSSKKRRIYEEVCSRQEKACRGDDGGQLKKLESNIQDPKRNQKRPNKMEGSEEKLAHKGASKCKQVNEFHVCQQNTIQLQVQVKDSEVEIPLPQGIKLTNVANVDLPAEDIGHALQFLEFCEAFGKVLDLKKGQPECLLREIAFGQSLRRSQGSLIIQFHIKLLSMIQNDSGKKYSLKTEDRNSWLQELNICISESQYQSQELLDCFNLGPDGYGELSFSKRLRLLNFLCDEVLGTLELRSWIDEQNLELVKEEKKAKLTALVEREKERNMKMQLQNEVATILMKGNAPHSISEHQDLVSKIKAEAAQILAGTLQAKDRVMKKERSRSNAVRSEPMLLDLNGLKFWKLRSYSGKRDILLQDIGNGDSDTLTEKWFSFNVEEGAVVEKYISRKLSE